jgi:hypothetical protein
MKANAEFRSLSKRFWAGVRSVSEGLGYSARGRAGILAPQRGDIEKVLARIGRENRSGPIDGFDPAATVRDMVAYFEYRAQILNEYVEPRLMMAERAQAIFEDLKKHWSPPCPLPMNKQSGAKKAPAYFIGIVNMLIQANAEGIPCDYNPHALTNFTSSGWPIRTFARRVDGAFPAAQNPIALWEIKEYHYTTTFGSRVADGIYETLLDGMEIEELRNTEGIQVLQYLMIDSHYTWWECGRSYLCRILDMLHMGYLDEALFGYEVVERLPGIVSQWVQLARSNEHIRLMNS